MPGLDQTGPEGKGPLTGRGRGKCGREKKSNNKIKNGDIEYRRYDRQRGGYGFDLVHRKRTRGGQK